MFKTADSAIRTIAHCVRIYWSVAIIFIKIAVRSVSTVVAKSVSKQHHTPEKTPHGCAGVIGVALAGIDQGFDVEQGQLVVIGLANGAA